MAVAPPLFKHTEDAAKESLLLFLSLIGLLSIGDSRRGSVSGHDLGTHRNRRLGPNKPGRPGDGGRGRRRRGPSPHARDAGVFATRAGAGAQPLGGGGKNIPTTAGARRGGGAA